jgi:3-hydroxymyristoyl/3-hydroxydecanoyl-(acyl carrier protein) dehydratase
MDFSSDPEKTITAALDRLRKRARVLPGDQIVVVSDVAAGASRVSALQVRVFE